MSDVIRVPPRHVLARMGADEATIRAFESLFRSVSTNVVPDLSATIAKLADVELAASFAVAVGQQALSEIAIIRATTGAGSGDGDDLTPAPATVEDLAGVRELIESFALRPAPATVEDLAGVRELLEGIALMPTSPDMSGVVFAAREALERLSVAPLAPSVDEIAQLRAQIEALQLAPTSDPSSAGALSATGVTAGTYGDAGTYGYPVITVDAQGRITSASTAASATLPGSLLQANSVGFAKLDVISGSTLLGNSTGGVANPAAVTIGAALTFSAGALDVKSAGINTLRLADGAVTNAKVDATAGIQLLKLERFDTPTDGIIIGREISGAGAGPVSALVFGGTSQALGLTASNGSSGSGVARSNHVHKGIVCKDEGVNLDSGNGHNTFDFTGSGVTATSDGAGKCTIAIPGAGTATITVAESDGTPSASDITQVQFLTSHFLLTDDTPAAGSMQVEIRDKAITLVKMADLAQDQFIVRTTASTGVPQTATCTAFARTILDDTTAAAVLTTLGVSTFVQTILDDADAATVRTTIGAAGSAAGSITNTMLAGGITGGNISTLPNTITNVTGSMTITPASGTVIFTTAINLASVSGDPANLRDIHYDSAAKMPVVNTDADTRYRLIGCVFQNTANSTPITATGVQQFDISWTPDVNGALNVLGKRIRIHAAGVLTAGANAGSLALGVKVGGTQVVSNYAIAYNTSSTSGWMMDWVFVVRTTGANGKFIVQLSEFVDYSQTITREGNNFWTETTERPAGGCDLTGKPQFQITNNLTASGNSNLLTDLAIFIEN